MKGNIWLIRNMEREYLIGQMEESTLDSGKMENNTAKEHIRTKKGNLEMEFGKVALEQNGRVMLVTIL